MITFKLNVPEILKLSDVIPDEHQGNWVYPTSDGRSLEIPPHVGRKISALGVETGEEISIGRYQQITGEPANWVICLTPRSEKARAEREKALAAGDVLDQLAAGATAADIEGSYGRSRNAQPLRKPPQPVRQESASATESPKGTGTYGPAAVPARAPRIARDSPPPRVSYRIAFQEITGVVLDLLNERKEQWESDPRQGLISTLLISACKANAVVFDFEPEGDRP